MLAVALAAAAEIHGRQGDGNSVNGRSDGLLTSYPTALQSWKQSSVPLAHLPKFVRAVNQEEESTLYLPAVNDA